MRNKKKAVRGIFLAAVMMSMAACGNAEETVSSGNPEAENVSENGTEETTTDGEESREASASAEDQEEAPASEEESEESSVSSEEAEESPVSSEETEEESASTEEPEDKTATDGSPQGAFPVKMTLYKEEKPSVEYLFDEEGYTWKLVGEGEESHKEDEKGEEPGQTQEPDNDKEEEPAETQVSDTELRKLELTLESCWNSPRGFTDASP